MLSDYERGFLEAAIDGEGCIRLKPYGKAKRTLKPTLHVTNTNLSFLEKVHNIVGKGNIRKKNRNKPRCKPLFELEVTGTEFLIKLFSEITLTVKERQKRIALEYLELKKSWGHKMSRDAYLRKSEEYRQQMKIVNHRGLP